MNRWIAVPLIIVACCGFACWQVLLGSFTGELDGGFTNLIQQPTGVKLEFVTGPCPPLCQNPPEFEYHYRLFTFTGVILPSDSEQVFVAHEVDGDFAAITAILADARIQADSQGFFCLEAAIPPITCQYGDFDSHWGSFGIMTGFRFPNARIALITMTLSPYAWVFDGSDWWMKQSNGSYATATVKIFGDPGVSIGSSLQSHSELRD